jgi:uncharacterized integral membrane protein
VQKIKTVFVVMLIMVLLIIMIQNAQPVTFTFLNWKYQVSQLLLVLIVFVLGFLTGYVVAKTGRKRKKDDPPLAPRPR